MNTLLSFPGCHRRGGVERVVFEAARHLSTQGHEVTLLCSDCPESPHEKVIYQEVRVTSSLHFMQGVRFHREAQKAIQLEKYDAYGSFGCVAPTGGVYWAQSVHAEWLEIGRRIRPLTSLGRWKQIANPVHKALIRLEKNHLEARQYRHVVALSPRVKSELNRHYKVPESDVTVLPNGFSTDEFNLEVRKLHREGMRLRLGLKKDDFTVIFVANEIERKGLPSLIRAFANLNHAKVRLLIVGRLNEKRIHSILRENRLKPEQVIVSGPTSEVAQYFAAADLFVLPTQYEAWGLVAVEAMACGIPVVLSELAGASVAVRSPDSGYLQKDPLDTDELTDLLRTSIERRGQWISKQISASVRHYGWDCILPKYTDVLAQFGV